MTSLSVLTLNVHKGFSPIRGQFVLGQLRDALRTESPDIVFLQEIVGKNSQHAENIPEWPSGGQYEYLADEVWSEHAYAQNAAYIDGHHGNAILSRYPIIAQHEEVLSASKFEQRTLLHVVVQWPDQEELHLCCVHLGMLEHWRMKQLDRIKEYVSDRVPENSPLIVAGDFNDWRGSASQRLRSSGLVEAHETSVGTLAKTFPSAFPLLGMDRIYMRAFTPQQVSCLADKSWRNLSDHLPLRAELALSKET